MTPTEIKNSPEKNDICDFIFAKYPPRTYKAIKYQDFVIERTIHGVSGQVLYAFYPPESWERKSLYSQKLGNYQEPEDVEVDLSNYKKKQETLF